MTPVVLSLATWLHKRRNISSIAINLPTNHLRLDCRPTHSNGRSPMPSVVLLSRLFHFGEMHLLVDLSFCNTAHMYVLVIICELVAWMSPATGDRSPRISDGSCLVIKWFMLTFIGGYLLTFTTCAVTWCVGKCRRLRGCLSVDFSKFRFHGINLDTNRKHFSGYF